MLYSYLVVKLNAIQLPGSNAIQLHGNNAIQLLGNNAVLSLYIKSL